MQALGSEYLRSCFNLLAQLSPVNPFSQVQIPLDKSHVPTDGSVQSSGHWISKTNLIKGHGSLVDYLGQVIYDAIPAQLSPKNPAKQLQVPVNVSHVPWEDIVQSSGQVKPKNT